jgi:predicted RNase H-like HicB family nuclease
MDYHLGIEDIEPGNWVAWVFEIPGCYARGSTRDQAVSLAPSAVKEHLVRLGESNGGAEDKDSGFRVVIAEEFRAFRSSPDYIVNAFFDNDTLPLTRDDIDYTCRLLSLNRDDLLAIVTPLAADRLDLEIPDEVQKNIRGILRHIGTAEWWYWNRLGLAFPWSELPDDVFTLLRAVREFTLHQLPKLVGSTQVANRSGEMWSPRKLVRRAVWHERVHTLQIARYLS